MTDVYIMCQKKRILTLYPVVMIKHAEHPCGPDANCSHHTYIDNGYVSAQFIVSNAKTTICPSTYMQHEQFIARVGQDPSVKAPIPHDEKFRYELLASGDAMPPKHKSRRTTTSSYDDALASIIRKLNEQFQDDASRSYVLKVATLVPSNSTTIAVKDMLKKVIDAIEGCS